jgi:hypothetical protein
MHLVRPTLFAEKSYPEKFYPREKQLERGNRIRKSEWLDLFSAKKRGDVSFLYEWKREENDLTLPIDSALLYKDTDDLITTHIGIAARKYG